MIRLILRQKITETTIFNLKNNKHKASQFASRKTKTIKQSLFFWFYFIKLRYFRAYSDMQRAPLTWTFKERITPACGISTVASTKDKRSARIPSRSFLQQRN